MRFDRGSVEDLVARGVSRERILALTGVDVGYCGMRYRKVLSGIDRAAYQMEYVCEIDDVVFVDLLNKWGDGVITRTEFYIECGVKESCKWTIRALSEAKGLLDVYLAADHRARVRNYEKGADTLERKYGVRCNMHVPGVFEKAQRTTEARFGTRNVMSLPAIQAKHRATTRAHYGVDYPNQAAEVRAKARATSMAKYNVDNPMKSPVIQARQRQGVFDSIGVYNPMELQSVRDKIAATNVEKYGFANPMQNPEVFAKFNAGLISKYGKSFGHLFEVPEILAKYQNTCRERFNGLAPLSSPDVLARFRATNRAKYGCDYFVETESFKNKARATLMRKHGVSRVCDIPGIFERRTATVLERFGVQNVLQSAEVRKMRSDAMFAKTGYHWPMQNPVVKDKMLATKAKNGTFGKSKAEDELYEKLVGHFGSDDVVRQYSSELYPYACDFYIKSRDMYIELNGFGTHGGHWFGSCALDVVLYENAKRLGESVCSYTDDNWVIRDVAKRETARKNNLNYVVFWGDLGQDADLWFALGCPDGHDWEREYSWIPDRVLYYDGAWPKTLTLGSGVISAAAHMANWRIFYEGEIALWNTYYDSKWGTIPVRLYVNRLKYLNKDVRELTNRDILRGLNISGMYHGYSSYNNSGMVEFLEKYKPVSIYDPCAGWGERMLTCAASGVQYLGVDINKRLMPGYLRLMRHYNLDNVGVIHGDSSKIDLSHGQQDCVFTCPPYEGFEIYTELGAENLNHDAFINWWRSVVQHSVGPNTRIFAYQINQSCKSDMNQVLLDAGWRLDSQIPVNVGKISHLSKSKGVKKKKNFEEIQVFVRDI